MAQINSRKRKKYAIMKKGWVGLAPDQKKRMLAYTVITLSGFYCTSFSFSRSDRRRKRDVVGNFRIVGGNKPKTARSAFLSILNVFLKI